MSALSNWARAGAGVVVLAVIALFAQPAGAAPAGVLVIGDSLEFHGGADLRRDLPGMQVRIDAEPGRQSGSGLGLLQQELRPTDRVVVFDLGVNDDSTNPGAYPANLETARVTAGARCLVIATLSRPPYLGLPVDGMNSEIRGFVAANPKVRLVEWRAAALANPKLISPDGTHPRPRGYQLRAGLIARAVKRCPGVKSPSGAAAVAPSATAGPGPAVLAVIAAVRGFF
jgi:hypothetical protein